MIRNYSDHAANERTFLAWLRTGLSIAAFGLVVERFNLAIAVLANSQTAATAPRGRWAELLLPFGRYDGFALALIGVVLIVIGSIRFMRTSQAIEDTSARAVVGTHIELGLSAILVLLASGFCVYLALQ